MAMDWGIDVALRADPSDLQRALRQSAGWIRQTGREVDQLQAKITRLGKGARVTVDDRGFTTAAAKADKLDRDLDGLYGLVKVNDDQLDRAHVKAGKLDRDLDRVGGRVRVDDREIRSAERRLSALKTTAKGLAIGGAATVAAGAGLGAAGFMAVDDIEKTRIAFEGLIGDTKTAGLLLEDLKSSAAKTPFELQGLADATQQLLGMGRAVDQVIPDMETIGGVAAVLGRSEEDIKGVVTALGQMAGKGKVTAEELNQIVERLPGFNARAAIAEARGTDVATAMADMEKGLVGADEGVEAILVSMKEFPGAAEAMGKMSETLSGKLSTLKDETQFALAGAFEPFKDEAAGTIDEASALISSRLPGLAASSAAMLEPLADVLLMIADQGAVGLGSIFDGIGAGLDAAGPGLDEFAGLLPDIGETLGDLAEVGIPALVEAGELILPFITPTTAALRLFLDVVDALPGPLRGAATGLAVLAASGQGAVAMTALQRIADIGPGIGALATKVDTLGTRGGAALSGLGAAGGTAAGGLTKVTTKTSGALSAMSAIPGVGFLAIGGLVAVAAAWSNVAEAAGRSEKASEAAADAIAEGIKGGDFTALNVGTEALFSGKGFDLEGIFGVDDLEAAFTAADLTRAEVVNTWLHGTDADVARMERQLMEAEDDVDSAWESFLEFAPVGGNSIGGVLFDKEQMTRDFGDREKITRDALDRLKNMSQESAAAIAEIQKQAGPDASAADVLVEIERRVKAGTIGYSEQTGVVKENTKALEARATALGISAEQYRQMDATEVAAAERQKQLTDIMVAGSDAMEAAGRGYSTTAEQSRAYFAVLADGRVTQNEAILLMDGFGLSATDAEKALGGVAEAQAAAMQMLAERLPTMATAVDSLGDKMETFSVQRVLDEMHRLTDAAVLENQRTTMLLAQGYDDLVSMVQGLAPEHRGLAVAQLLEMTPDQLAAAEARIEADSLRFGQSSGQLMTFGFAEALTLADPVQQQMMLIDVMMMALDNKVATPTARMNADPAMTVAQALDATIADIDAAQAEAHADLNADPAIIEADRVLSRLFAIAGLHPKSFITADGSQAETEAESTKSALNSVQDRRVSLYVDTIYSAIGNVGAGIGSVGNAVGQAYRGNAKGGIERPTGPNGLYRWAEPETGGELLLPRKGIGKGRALDLLSIGAEWYGADVVPGYAAGGTTAPMVTRPVTNTTATVTAPVTVAVNVSSSTSPGDIAAVVSRTLRSPETERRIVDTVGRAI